MALTARDLAHGMPTTPEDADSMEELRTGLQKLLNDFGRGVLCPQVGTVVVEPEKDAKLPHLVVAKITRWRKKIILDWEWRS